MVHACTDRLIARLSNGLLGACSRMAARSCTTSAPIPAALKRRYNYEGQDTVPLPPDLEGDRVSIKAYYLVRGVFVCVLLCASLPGV
jgi:hypothetical protein